MRSLPAHSDPVSGVDVVRDGTLIASCASDGLIRIWDTGTGQCLRTLVHEDNPPVSAVRFSPNGKYVLAWTHDDCVRLWDYVAGKCVKTYQGHVNKKYSLCGGFGIYGGHQARPNTTHGANDNEKHRNSLHPAAACAISGSEDGMIICWDVVSKQVLQHFRGHDGVVLGVDTYYNADKRLMVSCGLDRTVKVWEACFDENTDKKRDHVQVKEDMLHGVREHAYPTPARVDASLKNEGEPEQTFNKVDGVRRDSSVKMEDVDSWEGT
ncbi:WD domain protein [Ascosphaera atra]|nr:WD domain protein [Ascosphaera atra]